MKHEIKSIGVVSLMKIYALIGLVFGVLYGGIVLVAMLLGAISIGDAGAAGGMMVVALIIAAVAVIGAPIGCAISGAFAAIIYNIIAKMVGGIEIEFNDKSAKKE
jgi:predicted exporter